VGLTNLGSESETCVGSRVHLVGASISFEKNFYRLPFTPPSLVRRIGPSTSPSRANLEVFGFSSLDGCPATATCLASTQALRSRRVSSASKHLGASDQGDQTAPLGRLDRPGGSDRPSRSDRPSWAVEPAWVATPPRRVFGRAFATQPSYPVVFW
jgi:hypothetical protein